MPDEELEPLRRRLYDVVSAFTELKQQPNGEWRGLCPLHDERTPSFDVNTEKNVFKCFGCGQGGSVFDFLMVKENIDFPTAVKKVQNTNGVYTPPPNLPPPKRANKPKQKPAKSADGRELTKRGVQPTTFNLFSIARCSNADQGIYWEYPTWFSDGSTGRFRRKFCNPELSGQKYSWVGKRPEDGGMPQPEGYPMDKVAGVERVWIFGGEVAVWLGHQHDVPCVCPLGEGKGIEKFKLLLEALKKSGVKIVDVLLDNDDAGRTGSARIHEAAKSIRNLECHVYKWFSVAPGYDVADLSELVEHDSKKFVEHLGFMKEVTNEKTLAKWLEGSDEEGDDESNDASGDVQLASLATRKGIPREEKTGIQDAPERKGRVCPNCQKPAIVHLKAEKGGGWICLKKLHGCGTKFPDGEERIESQEEPEKPQKESQKADSSNLLPDTEVFKTEENQAFIVVDDNGAKVTLNVDSMAFQDYLVEKDQRLKSEEIEMIRRQIGSRARRSGDVRQVHLRVGSFAKRIYVDLCNRAHEVVEIGEGIEGGWRVITEPPQGVHFRRTDGMEAMPTPERSDAAETWREFKDLLLPGSEANWILMLSWIIGCYRDPTTPFIGLCVTGEQDSGKSFRSRMLRQLVDPNRMVLTQKPREERDLIARVQNSFCIGFDNMSGVPTWLSDSLCQIATLGCFPSRTMRTNTDETLVRARRPMLLNGIDEFMGRPDFKRRCLFVHIPRFEEGQKRRESVVEAEFYELRPRLLGAIFDAVALALSRQHEPGISDREVGEGLLDFADWVVKAEPALPWKEGAFLTAYRYGQLAAQTASVEDSTFLAAVLELSKDERKMEDWEEKMLKADALFRLIKDKAIESRSSPNFAEMTEYERDQERRAIEKELANDKSWPNSVRGAMMLLNRGAPHLRQMGVVLEHDQQFGFGRYWKIKRIEIPSVDPQEGGATDIDVFGE